MTTATSDNPSTSIERALVTVETVNALSEIPDADLPDDLHAMRLAIEAVVLVGFNSNDGTAPVLKQEQKIRADFDRLFAGFKDLRAEKMADRESRALAQCGSLGGALLAVSALLAVASTTAPSAASTSPEEVRTVQTVARVGGGSETALDGVPGVRVVATSDVTCKPEEPRWERGCRDTETAVLAASYDPKVILGVGDLNNGTGSYPSYLSQFDQSWGALKPLIRPVPGNHDYFTPRARGYFRYFKDTGIRRPGWYAFNIKNWRVYALNTNCTEVNCKKQANWLRKQMRKTPRKCSIVMGHHPRYSSGLHGSHKWMSRMTKIAAKHGTDIAFAGHDHHYERFAPRNAHGKVSRTGMQQFIVGLGGKSIRPFHEVDAGSRYRYNSNFGVMGLSLGEDAYAWEFKTVDGDVIDSGIRACS